MSLFDYKFPEDLYEWQESPMVHPYTCPNRDDGNHVESLTGRHDPGTLTVTGPRDLRCDSCGYTQHLDKVFFNEKK